MEKPTSENAWMEWMYKNASNLVFDPSSDPRPLGTPPICNINFDIKKTESKITKDLIFVHIYKDDYSHVYIPSKRHGKYERVEYYNEPICKTFKVEEGLYKILKPKKISLEKALESIAKIVQDYNRIVGKLKINWKFKD